jgi:hypothetical protein
MKDSTHRRLLFLAMTVVLAPMAFAQGGPGGGNALRGPATHADFDRNGDGIVTESEFDATRAERIAQRSRQGYRMRNLGSAPTFEQIDRNDDGQLDVDELATAQAQHRSAKWR